MKQIILLFLTLVPLFTQAQIQETFSESTLSEEWTGADRDKFGINDAKQLQLMFNPKEKGVATLSRQINYANSMEWEFEVYMKYEPSNQNKLCVYLYRESEEQYFFIQLGFSGTCDLGFRRKGNVDLIERKEHQFATSGYVQVKVVLTDLKQWTVYSRESKVAPYTLEGTTTTPILSPKATGSFDLEITYSKTRSDQFRIGNIHITPQTSETPTDPEEPTDPEPVEEEPAVTPTFPAGTVIFNEVMAKPGSDWVEYIELYNTSSTAVSLKDWVYKNVNGKKSRTLPDVSLPAKGYALLYDSNGQIALPATALAVPIEKFPALNDKGSTLELYDASGALMDEVTYEAAETGRSWEKGETAWHLSTDRNGGTPGAKNSTAAEGEEHPTEEEPSTPEEPNDPETLDDPTEPEQPVVTTLVEARDLVINELLPDPFSGGSEYFELYNRSDKTLSLQSLSVAVRKSDGSFNTRYSLASVSRILEPGDYIVLTKSASGVCDYYNIQDEAAICEVAKLPILANLSSSLALFRTADELIIDEVSYSSRWHAESVTNTKGVALERLDPDGDSQSADNWSSASSLVGFGTPGYRNSQYRDEEMEGAATGIEAPVWQHEGCYQICYQLDRAGYNCRAMVFDTSGRCVAEVMQHELLGSAGTLSWDGMAGNGRKLPTGIYIFYAELYHTDGITHRYKKAFLIR